MTTLQAQSQLFIALFAHHAKGLRLSGRLRLPMPIKPSAFWETAPLARPAFGQTGGRMEPCGGVKMKMCGTENVRHYK